MTKTRKTIIIFALLFVSVFMFWHEKARFHSTPPAQVASHQTAAIQDNAVKSVVNEFANAKNEEAAKPQTEEEQKHQMFLERSAEIQRQAQHQAQELQEKTKNNPQEMLHQIVTGFM